MFGENFPYTNFHDLNMDWIVKIAKDFLEQYTSIQETIDTGLDNLEEKAEDLEAALQQWYNTHSEDIANQLSTAVADLGAALTAAIADFNQRAEAKGATVIASIPADYSELSAKVDALEDTVIPNDLLIGDFTRTLTANAQYPFVDIPITASAGDILSFQMLSYSGDTDNLSIVYILDVTNNIDYGAVVSESLGLYNQRFKTIQHDCTSLRVIATQTETPSDPITMHFQMYIVNGKSLLDIGKYYLPTSDNFNVSIGINFTASDLPITADVNDIIMVECKSNLIKYLQIGYKSGGNNVDNILRIDIANGYTRGFARISEAFDPNSLRFFVAGDNVIGTGTVKILWANITKIGSIVPYKHYSSFSILGDSFSTLKGYDSPDTNPFWYPTNNTSAQGYNTGNNVTNLIYMWWYIIANETELYMHSNASYSGSTVCYDSYGTGGNDGKDASFVMRADDLENSSLLFIFGGMNDYWAGASIGDYIYSGWTESDLETFAPALAYLIDKIKRKYVGMDIAYIESDSLSANYKTAIETVCAHYDVPVIKLHDVSKTSNHPNTDGMRTIAEQIKSFLAQPKLPYYD